MRFESRDNPLGRWATIRAKLWLYDRCCGRRGRNGSYVDELDTGWQSMVQMELQEPELAFSDDRHSLLPTSVKPINV